MIIAIDLRKLQQFDQLAQQIIARPEYYLPIEHVSDFYQLECLNLFPEGTQWYCSGLDDGAESFYAVICYKDRRICIECLDELNVRFDKISDS